MSEAKDRSPLRQSPEDPPVQSRNIARIGGEKDPLLQSEAGTEPAGSLIESLTYAITIPERTARSVSAIVGGFVNESAARLIPAAFRSSRSYSVFVQQALDIMVHDVGGVQSQAADDSAAEESMLAQKAVGGLLDVAGAATLHLSPMTVLAVFNDLAYGSGYYLAKLSEELKREGVIDPDSSIDHVADLVRALESTSAKAADTFDTPPVSVEGIKLTITQLTDEIAKVDPRKLIPQSEVARVWSEMEQAASNADVGLWDVSTTMTMYALNRVALTSRGAFSTISLASSLFDEHVIRHYGDALAAISENGFYATLAASSAPYLDAVWQNFQSGQETWTEELITGRLIGKAFNGVRGWYSADETESPRDRSEDQH